MEWERELWRGSRTEPSDIINEKDDQTKEIVELLLRGVLKLH